jgi:Protein of unknown function (DUF1064)
MTYLPALGLVDTPRIRGFPMRNKFRNIWTEYAGVKYASKREARYAAELDLRVKAGEIASWRRQVKIPLRINGRKITNYVIDFEVRHHSGVLEYIEVKGFQTAEWRLKWALFDALWPHLRKSIVK